jgi:hypothetical protein
MKLPALPKKKGSENKTDGSPAEDGQSRRKPKVVFYQGLIAPRPVDKTEKKIPVSEWESTAPAATEPQAAAPEPGPKSDTASEAAYLPEEQAGDPVLEEDQAFPPYTAQDDNPGRRLLALEASGKDAPAVKIPWRYRLLPNREGTHRAFWDIAAIISLVVNIILIGLLVIMAGQVKNLKATMGNLLGGLYGNFVEMDEASINTTILVDAQIPLDFNLPVVQNTDVILTRDVEIPKAHVVINTGGLAIDALASVTLPVGTSLPIALNLNIPVQSTIPVSLQVPVSIPMNQTELHGPFAGLQSTLRPLYCLLNKNAQYPEGVYICTAHDTPTPATP